jgi:NADH dehydrogenase
VPVPPHILILGGGFGGAYCASHLEKRLRHLNVQVTLIDRHNYFIFYPLLVEAGTGSVQPRHAVVPIRNYLRKTRFIMADVRSIDPARQSVRIQIENQPEQDLPYDHLILALGSISKLPPIPGLKEHAYQMKTLADAIALRDRAIQLLEEADAMADRERSRKLLHFAVVGGNYTGIEVAGEFDDYLKRAARRYPNVYRDDIKITLVDANDRVMSMLDEELSDWAARHLVERGIELRLNELAAEITPDALVLKSGARISASTVIWCAGIAAPPILRDTGLPLDKLGYVLCTPDLRVQNHTNIWGLGDCAVKPGPDGQPYPATAQLAILQAKQLATNLKSVLTGKPTAPCTFRSKGMIAAFGRFDAVAKVFRFRLTGFLAWFLWRTVYLTEMPGLSRKVRVALDWTLDLVFGRDYVELGVHRVTHSPTQTPRQDHPGTAQDGTEKTHPQEQTFVLDERVSQP